jgi:hypothetical protein
MRVPEFQPIAAGFAALLLLASVAWWLVSVPEVIDPGFPTWKGADIVSLKADVPVIADFPVFYTNDENPFVPLAARREETSRHDSIRNPPKYTPPPPPPKIPPIRPPVVVIETEKPKLVLPKLSPAPANAPLVYGLVAVDGTEGLIVRMPGAKDSIRMATGDKANGWTLVSIDNGNLATFTDPQGVEQRFAIGQGDLAVAQGDSGGPTTGKAGTGKNLVPKPPTDPTAKPPGGKVDGAIPRPPPREERRRPPKDGEKVPPPPQAPPKK